MWISPAYCMLQRVSATLLCVAALMFAGCQSSTEPSSPAPSAATSEESNTEKSIPDKSSGEKSNTDKSSTDKSSTPQAGSQNGAVYNQFVFASWKTPERTISRPGLVIARDGDKTLVATATAFKAPDAGEEILLSTNVDAQRQDTPGKFVGSITTQQKFVFSADGTGLPTLPTKTPATISVGTKLTVWGYEFKDAKGGLAFARVKLDGTVTQLLRASNGELLAIRIQHERPAPRINIGLAATNDGAVVACVQLNSQNPQFGRAPEGQLDLQPLEVLANLVEPQMHVVQTAAIDGDLTNLTYEWGVWLSDPIQRTKAVKLVVNAIDARSPTFNPQDFRKEPAEPLKPLTTGDTLELTRRPHAAAAEIHFRSHQPNKDMPWCGSLKMPNPGPLPQQIHKFEVQVSSAGADGKWKQYPRQFVEFRARDSKIPGLDGKPLDIPTPQLQADGTHRVTSARTRVELMPQQRATFPQPLAEVRPLAKNQSGYPLLGVVAKTEKIPYGKRNDFLRPQVAISPQGRYAFVAGIDKSVHKFDLESLTEVANLKADGDLAGVALSQAGVIVGLEKPAAVWVLDKDLRPLREIKLATPATEKVERHTIAVAASPATKFGFVLTKSPADDLQPGGNTLWLVDFEKGVAHHALKEFLGGQGGVKRGWGIGNVLPLGDTYGGWTYLRMGSDGKQLLISADHSSLCRLDGTATNGAELDFVSALPNVKNARLLLTPDGQTIGQLAHANQQYTLTLYDPLKQWAELAIFEKWSQDEVYGLLARDRIVSANAEGKLTVRDGNGKFVATVPRVYPAMTYITPLSNTKFLGHSEQGIVLCDLNSASSK